jgi:hypothetical protein
MGVRCSATRFGNLACRQSDSCPLVKEVDPERTAPRGRVAGAPKEGSRLRRAVQAGTRDHLRMEEER